MNDQHTAHLCRFMGFVLISIILFCIKDYKVYAQYDEKEIFSKMYSPYNDADPDSQILYLYFDDNDEEFDPAECYSKNELEIISNTYEPPLAFHYLKRPYELIPLTAKKVPEPIYFREIKTKKGNVKYEKCTANQMYSTMRKGKYSNNTILPKSESDEPQNINEENLTGQILITYRIEITPGIYYAPHPCFAQDKDGYLYHKGKGKGRSIDYDLGDSIEGLEDFPYFSTRELVASDYVYGIRRLFNPNVDCPILNSVLTKYIAGGHDFSTMIQKAITPNSDEDEDSGYYRRYYNSKAILPYCDYKFEGVKEIDKYTFEINLFRPYENFKYWLAMYFFSPIPWEADVFYNETQSSNFKHFSFETHPVGTGPYNLRYYSRYSGYSGIDKYNEKFPMSNSRYFISSQKNPFFNRLANETGKTPPIYNDQTGYGVDKNKNGKVDNGELPFYDMNKNGKYDGIENGEGYYFEDVNNNGKKDDNESWYELPASYRTTYPEDGMLNITNADLKIINGIRTAQKKALIRNNKARYTAMQEKAEEELIKLRDNGVDINKIGDFALGNLLDAGRRLPFIDRILRIRMYENIRTLPYLANGYVDYFEPDSTIERMMLYQNGDDVNLLQPWAKTKLQLCSEPLLTTSFWGINMLDPKIGWNERLSTRASDSKRKIRQAIAIAFDLETWARKFGLGMKVSKSFVPPSLLTKNQLDSITPNLWVYEPDGSGSYKRRSIDEAKRLLKEAGWENGKNRDGFQLTIEMDSRYFKKNPDELEWFKRQFSKIGIKINTEKEVSGVEIAYGKYQLFFTGWNADYPDPENFALLFYGPNHESLIKNVWGGVNKANYMNPAYDEQYEQLVKTQNLDEKMQILNNLFETVNFDAPTLGFVNSKQNITHFPWLMNFKLSVITGRQFAYQRIDTERRKKLQAAIKELYE